MSFEFSKEDVANWYMKLLKSNPVIMQNSRIFNDDRMNNLFSSEQLKEISIYKEKMKRIALHTYNNVVKNSDLSYINSNLSNSNIKQLLDYILLNMDGSDPEIFFMRENIISKVMNDLENANNMEKEFVLRCFAYDKCKSNGLDSANIIFAEHGDRCSGCYINNSNVIYIYSGRVRYANNIELFANCIKTINHEVDHYIQKTNEKEGIFSFRGYISSMDAFLKRYFDQDNYINNYSYCETEQYADNKAYHDTVDIIKKYYVGDLSFLDKFLEKSDNKNMDVENLGYHLDNEQNIESRAQFNIKTLIRLVSNNPSILEEYPLFKKFFDNNGNLKKIETLASDYYYSSEDERLVYSDLIEYLFSSSKLMSSIDLSLFSNNSSKLGLIEMIKFDFDRKLNKLIFISDNLNNVSSSNELAMDVKKLYYDIGDSYASSIENEYMLLRNVNGVSIESLNLPIFLEESRKKISSLSSSDLFLYSGTSEKLNNIVSDKVSIK